MCNLFQIQVLCMHRVPGTATEVTAAHATGAFVTDAAFVTASPQALPLHEADPHVSTNQETSHPYTSALLQISGSISVVAPKCAMVSACHCPVLISIQLVRAALLMSVTCMPPSLPPAAAGSCRDTESIIQ